MIVNSTVEECDAEAPHKPFSAQAANEAKQTFNCRVQKK